MRVGVAERRERDREELRRKILDSARTLFARDGYESVTMRAIADAIEYSPTAIYHHFEDKNDLVLALCDEDFKRLLGALQHEAAPADPVERIRQLGRGYAAFGISHPNHYRFMFMTPSKPRHEDGNCPLPGMDAFGLLGAAVAAAVADGAFRPIDPLTGAQILWANIHGAVSLLVTLEPDQWPQGRPAPDLVERVVENGIRGLRGLPSE
jgi:AcrR family transcriptional regulator